METTSNANQTETPNKKRRWALYARVSTQMQNSGLDAQIRALRIFCEQNNVTEYELFADENQSGTKSSRPALDRMMKAVENGEIETVVVFAFSRYARSVSHMLRGLECFRKHKVNFVSLSEKLDLNTSLGNVVFIIISAIAQLERDLIAERVRNGLAAAKARGKILGRARKRNSALIEQLLQAGLSFREIAKIANCSHGSVSAQKKELQARLAKEKAAAQNQLGPSFFDESHVSPTVQLQIEAARNVNPVERIPTDEFGTAQL